MYIQIIGIEKKKKLKKQDRNSIQENQNQHERAKGY